MNRVARALVLVIVVLAVGLVGAAPLVAAQTREAAAIEHAKRVLQLLQEDKIEEVVKDFNAQMTAALTVVQLRDVWSTLRQQVGALKSVIDERATVQATGITAVVLGCQFEKTELNVIIAFNGENKIGGLRFAPRASAAAPATPPSSSRFTEEAVTVGTGEWALPGTLSMPVGPIAAAVVLVHGSGPNDRDETIGPNKPFRELAWGLADRGIAVLRYEKRSRQHGGKIASIPNFTVREEVIDDALLAVGLLRKHDRIDPKRVFVLGHSLGGMVAPRIAADDPALAGLVIMAGPTRPLQEVAREQIVYLASLNAGATNVEERLQLLLKNAPDSYWKDLDAYKPAQVAATLRTPMLILQGERDYQVTDADLKGWRDALAGKSSVTIKSYPALNHLFLPGEGKSTPADYDRPGHIPDGVLDDIAGWIRKN